MMINLDGVKYHIVPHTFGNKTASEMWKDLESLYQRKNEYWKMALQERMHNTKMAMGEGVVDYLTNLT